MRIADVGSESKLELPGDVALVEQRGEIDILAIVDATARRRVAIPRLIRHRWAGVWVIYLYTDASPVEALLLPVMYRGAGRHVWSWQGGQRLECSQLAARGLRVGDQLGEVTEVDLSVEGTCEVLPMRHTVLRAGMALPSAEERG